MTKGAEREQDYLEGVHWCLTMLQNAHPPARSPSPDTFLVKVCKLIGGYNEHEGAREYPGDETVLGWLKQHLAAYDDQENSGGR